MRLLNQTVAEGGLGMSQKRDCPKAYFHAIDEFRIVADEM